MSGTQIAILGAIAVYFIVMVAVGILYGRKQDAGGIILYSRKAVAHEASVQAA